MLPEIEARIPHDATDAQRALLSKVDRETLVNIGVSDAIAEYVAERIVDGKVVWNPATDQFIDRDQMELTSEFRADAIDAYKHLLLENDPDSAGNVISRLVSERPGKS